MRQLRQLRSPAGRTFSHPSINGLRFLRVCHSIMELVNAIQWPAMAVTVIAAWMVGSQKKFKRNWGFWLFLLSNVLWIAWGVYDHAFALIFLQLCLAFLNVRGAMKNSEEERNAN
jgi:hypothetical protein